MYGTHFVYRRPRVSLCDVIRALQAQHPGLAGPEAAPLQSLGRLAGQQSHRQLPHLRAPRPRGGRLEPHRRDRCGGWVI